VSAPEAATRRPNILIFMTDQEQGDVVRPDHPCQTPHATALLRRGLLFSSAFAPTAHCCPSRATFLTGLYPSRHGIHNNVSTPTAINRALNPGVRMFSEVLGDAGYRLRFSGKWHVSDVEDPEDRAWEQLTITAGRGSDMHRSPAQWREQARAPEPDGPRRRGCVRRPGWGDYQLYETVPAGGPLGYEDDGDWPVVRDGLRAIEELAGGDAPWCLYVGPLGPHDPFVVPEPFVRRYDPAEIPLPPSFGDRLTDKPGVYRRLREQVWGQLSEQEVRESIAHYWAYCTLEDTYLGLLLDALDATGQREDTLVLRLSDHGEYAGAHGLYLKGVPAFREGYQIACIASWPAGIVRPGRVVEDIVTLADIAPTLIEVAGLPVDPKLTGRSLAPLFRDERPADWPDAFFSQLDGVELFYTQRAVRTRDHAYVFNGFDFDELYDLRDDPHELTNVAGRPAYEAVEHDLVRRMWRFAAAQGDHTFNPYPSIALAPWGPADALRD
jgi:arylsulfatase A-like enzyme